jgi:hypothetical protein
MKRGIYAGQAAMWADKNRQKRQVTCDEGGSTQVKLPGGQTRTDRRDKSPVMKRGIYAGQAARWADKNRQKRQEQTEETRTDRRDKNRQKRQVKSPVMKRGRRFGCR